MRHEKFVELAAKKAAEIIGCNTDDIFIVWSAKVLQNSKIIVSSKITGAPMLEVTMDGNNGVVYFDVYRKIEQRKVFFTKSN